MQNLVVCGKTATFSNVIILMYIINMPNFIFNYYHFHLIRYVELRLDSLVKLIPDKVQLVEFLMQRKNNNSKRILIQVIRDLVTRMPTSLMDMPAIFDKLNAVYRNHLENEIQSVMGTPLQNNTKNVTTVPDNFKYKIFLDQSDMYSHILSKFPEGTIDSKMIIWVLLEYIRYVIFFFSLITSLQNFREQLLNSY